MSLIAGNLGVVQRLLDTHEIVWGICAGAASHLYGERRPIQDIDILVAMGTLDTVVQVLKQQQKAVQFDGQRALWRGIEVFEDLSVRRSGSTHAFVMDTPMRSHLRRMPLLGSRVAVLAPEDIVIHKLLLGRGLEQRKHDYSDATSIIRRQKLDLVYLEERIRLSNAGEIVGPKLEELGVALSHSMAP